MIESRSRRGERAGGKATRAGKATRGGSQRAREETRRRPRYVLGSRVGLEREHQTRSFVVPAVPRSRRSRSRRRGGRARLLANAPRTSARRIRSSSTRRPSVTKVPSSSTSRVRSVPRASRAPVRPRQSSASAPASSRSRGPTAARARVSTGRRRPERHRGDARPPGREGRASPLSSRCVTLSDAFVRASSLARFLRGDFAYGALSSAGARFFRGGCPTRKTTLARSVTLARAHGRARSGVDTSDVDATEERPAGRSPARPSGSPAPARARRTALPTRILPPRPPSARAAATICSTGNSSRGAGSRASTCA